MSRVVELYPFIALTIDFVVFFAVRYLTKKTALLTDQNQTPSMSAWRSVTCKLWKAGADASASGADGVMDNVREISVDVANRPESLRSAMGLPGF